MVIARKVEAVAADSFGERREFPRSLPRRISRGSAKPARVMVGDIPIDRLSMDAAVQWVVEGLDMRATMPPLLIMASNAQLVTLAAADRRVAQAILSAHLNVPDGISVVVASRLLGCAIPERVTGGDLMERLCAESARNGFRVFFLGGLPGAATLAAMRLKRRYPALQVAGCYCPDRGFENDAAKSANVRRLITEAAPDLLCVALGAPKQEIWMQENCATLPIGAAISVGGALDTTAGLRSRAPQWTHKVGLEWLYRLIREPRRLARRYVVGNAMFIVLVGFQLARQAFGFHRATREEY